MSGSFQDIVHVMSPGVAGGPELPRWSWLVGLVVVAALLSPAGAAQAPTRRPNVLLILTDDQPPSITGSMPTIDTQLIGKGIRFTNAIMPTSLCCPSRTSFLTGNYSHTTGVWSNRPPFGGFLAFNDSATIATALHGNGYRTGLFGKYLNAYDTSQGTYVPPGWDDWHALLTGSLPFFGPYDVSNNGREQTTSPSAYSTVDTARHAADFISSTPSDQPLFAMWTPVAPHSPAIPEERYARDFSSIPPYRPPSFNETNVTDKPPWVRNNPALTPAQIAGIDEHRKNMYRSMQSVDNGVRLLLDTLSKTGRLANTVIVFASDNGYLQGEHRIEAGKMAPYAASVEVPFIIRYDPMTEPGTSSALVGNIDFAPTIAALTHTTLPYPTDGLSLVPIMKGTSHGVRTMIAIEHMTQGGVPGFCGVRRKNQLYVRYTKGAGAEFYDYRTDPWELYNAIHEPSAQSAIRVMQHFARATCSPTPPGFSW